MINERDGLLRLQSAPWGVFLHRSRAEFRLAVPAGPSRSRRRPPVGRGRQEAGLSRPRIASLNGGATASFQRKSDSVRLSLELLEKAAFPFASCRGLEYLVVYASPKGPLFFMIICSCNVLSDDDVRNAVNASEDLPRNPKQIYGCLGCSAECGRCARTIKTIIDEALGACAKECCSGCPHSRHAANDEPAQEAAPSFALAAC